MTNLEAAEIFDRIAVLLEIKGEVIYKTLAYRRTAENLRNLGEDINTVYQEGRLLEIPGVGKAIAEKISELLSTGTLDFLERLEIEIPPTLIDLLEVPDVGPKRAAMFWKEAGITTLPQLEQAVRSGQLRHLPGMGEKSEARILAGVEALSRRSKRLLLDQARRLGNTWLEWLKAQPGILSAEIAGSLRRWKTTIGDIDLVAASNEPEPIMHAFINHADVVRVIGEGSSKSSIELANGVNVQLWIQPPQSFGSLLQFVTGSKDHNVRVRELAQRKGLSISERGIQDSEGGLHPVGDEGEIYQAIGMPWIPPELREDRGEITAALENRLPRLLTSLDFQAEIHCHTIWSDGQDTIRAMAQAALHRGLKVLAITDHSGGLGIAGGLSIEKIRDQRKEIEIVQAELGDSLQLFQGCEVEIRSDGSLDFPDDILAELDLVIASLHINLRQPRQSITERLVKAMSNPHVDIIGHPSGRLMPNREGADLDWDIILSTALEKKVALEINASPERLDLDEVYARRAGEMGILLSVNTDAHNTARLFEVEYGISVARRAWVNPDQIINTWSNGRLITWLAQRGKI